MNAVLTDPIVRRELSIAASNAAVGVLLALVVGVAARLWWVGALVAVATFGAGAVSDRRGDGTVLSIGLLGLFALGFATLGAAGNPILPLAPLVIVGTAVGFGANRLVFGVVRPVPTSRRERHN